MTSVVSQEIRVKQAQLRISKIRWILMKKIKASKITQWGKLFILTMITKNNCHRITNSCLILILLRPMITLSRTKQVQFKYLKKASSRRRLKKAKCKMIWVVKKKVKVVKKKAKKKLNLQKTTKSLKTKNTSIVG